MSRDLDPRFSTALRDELIRRADAVEAEPVSLERRLPRRQVWIAIVTAAVVIGATVGVLHVVRPRVEPASPGPSVVAPLSRITDPRDAVDYVARAVRTLLDARGIGTGSRVIDVPADVTAARVYIACAPAAHYAVRVEQGPASSSDCDRGIGGWAGGRVRPGRRTVTVRVPQGVHWAVTIIAEPAPAVSNGPLIDPLAQVRDRRVPDAIPGDTRPLLRVSGTGPLADLRFTVPSGSHRVRVLFACRPASAAASATVDGRRVIGCQNSVAHWFDFTPASGADPASVRAQPGLAWSLLIIPAPPGAQDSPANALLPFPVEPATPLVQVRGAGAQASGVYTGPADGIRIRLTCRGTGWLEVSVGSSGTNTRGQRCAAVGRAPIGFGGDEPERSQRVPWSVTPHGDISWTATITRDD